MNPLWMIFIMFLAFIVTEGTVEYLLGTAFDKIERLKPYKWLLMYASAGLGIFIAAYYSIDMIYLLASELGIPGVSVGPVGIAATGILMGRGANFVNDLWQRFFPAAGARTVE